MAISKKQIERMKIRAEVYRKEAQAIEKNKSLRKTPQGLAMPFTATLTDFFPEEDKSKDLRTEYWNNLLKSHNLIFATSGKQKSKTKSIK